MSRSYTTVEELENYLTINIDDNFEVQIEKWIEAVSNFVAETAGREFLAGDTETKHYDGNNKCVLSINEAVEVTGLTIGEEVINLDDVILYPYNKLPIRRLFLKKGVFPYGLRNIAVEGKFGASTAIPEDIRFITTVYVAGIILAQTQQEGEVESEKIGNYSVKYTTEAEKNDFKMAKEMLNVRRKLVI